MATLTLIQPVDLTNLPIWTGSLNNETASSFSLADNAGNSAVYYGKFNYLMSNPNGVITGFDDFLNGNLVYSTRNLPNLKVTKVFHLLKNHHETGLLNYALSGNDNVTGSPGNDTLTAGAGINTLTGGGGNDTFIFTKGSNFITDFGAGQDVIKNGAHSIVTATVIDAWTATKLNQNAGTVNFVSNSVNVDLSLALGPHGYNLSDNGTTGVSLTGSAFNDTLTGGPNNDTLTGGKGADKFITLSGEITITDLGNGADILKVASAASVNATLAGAWQATAQTSNAGSVTLNTQGFAIDLSSTKGGHGYIIHNIGAATHITGSKFADTLSSSQSADTLTGGGGNDSFIIAGKNVNITDFGKGADILDVQAGASVNANVVATWTADKNTVNNGLATLTSNGKNVNLAAASGDHGYKVVNIGGSATLTSSSLPDTLIGGNGNDTFVINGGGELLSCGSGENTLIFNTLDKLNSNPVNIDNFVSDKNELHFSATSYTGIAQTSDSISNNQFLSGANITSATTTTQRFIYNTTTGALYYDADGSGANANPVEIAILGVTNHPKLQATDIFISA